MPDKLTDKDIIKALESEIHLAEYVDSDYCSNVNLEIIKSAHDLITRQQAEIEKLNIELSAIRGAANSLKMHYEEAQSEIERLQNTLLAFMSALGKVENVEDIESIPQIPIMWELNKQFRAEIESAAVKEFAERLKTEYAKGMNWFKKKESYYVDVGDIDNLVKEMVGEDNA